MGVVIAMMGWLVLIGSLPGSGWKEELPEEGELLTVTGRVYDVQVKQIYDTGQLWIYMDSIKVQSIDASPAEADISYHMICITDSGERPLIGSRIQVTGQFEPFSTATNPGQFDFAQYYETLGIGGKLKKAQLLSVSKNFSVTKEKLFVIREYWKERLYQCFPEKEASVFCAMILGDKAGVDSEIKELYQQNGIVHILSISGLHITLIGMGLYRLLRKGGCPVLVAAVLGAVFLGAYGVMTGLGVSSIRAIGMYLIRMLGEILGRTYDMLTALGIMAMLMLAVRPAYLNNGGFLLSFGSICGIGLVLPRLERDSERNPIKKAILPGLSITLFTLPIQLKLYYEIPAYSIFLNLLVLPFMGTIMAVGIAVMIIPGIQWVGWLDVLILRGYEWLCTFFGALPGHMWNPGAPDSWQIVVYYILLLVALQIAAVAEAPGDTVGTRTPGKQLQKAAKRGGKWILIIMGIWILSIRLPQELTITFLDVGQGDCICVRTKEETYLFDCGSSSKRSVAENILIPYLKQEGIRRLDAVFVSHPDSDHISGIIELMEIGNEEGIAIERLILPRIAEERREEEFEELLLAAKQAGGAPVPVSYMAKGTVWQSGKVSFCCLHPDKENHDLDSNAYSQCFYIKYGQFSMLLTGDVEGDGEKQLQKTLEEAGVQNISLLKVAHHGSRYSTSQELLEILRPTASIISCGKDNSYGHPHEEVLDRLEEVGAIIYMTPRTGAVEMNITGTKWKIKTYLE